MTKSRVLDEAKTPAEWVRVLHERGLTISERTLRTKARELGACVILGRAMLMLPEHIDAVFEAPTRRFPNVQGQTLSPEVARALDSTNEDAIAHLQRRSKVGKRPKRR